MQTPVTPVDPKRRNALGKGIESLLGPRPQAPAAAAAEPGGKPLEIPLELIERNPHQTRTTFDEGKLAELAQSIESTGVVQPIVVRQLAGGRYQLIMGERRWRASQVAGKKTIPAIVRQVSDALALEMTIVENLQRADLNPMEQARAYQRLSQEFHLTQDQVAVRTGKDRVTVANFVRLLKLPNQIQQLVEAGKLSFGHARALLSLTADQIDPAARKVMELAMSVRQTEKYVQEMMMPKALPKGRPAPPPQDPNVHEAQGRLQRRLGLKVHIEDKKGKGRVIIEYSGVDDFDALLSALGE